MTKPEFGKWQPIETASKEMPGEWILGIDKAGWITSVLWWPNNQWRDMHKHYWDITHWMPLPRPPEEQKGI